jgi:NTE family protein
MLRALVEVGVQPDVIIGCSVGAINGAAFAAEPSLRGVARLDRVWQRLADGDPALMPNGFIPLAVQLARKGASIHDPARLRSLLEQELQVEHFAELRVPFQCVATDLGTASEHWFDDGPLIPAILASASLPAVYPAMELDGRILIDGGVLNEVHTHRAVAWGATDLYVLHVGHLQDRSDAVQRPFDGALRAYWTARRYRFNDDLGRVPPHCTVHLLPAGTTPRLRFDDFSRGPELAATAYELSVEYLRAGQAAPPEVVPATAPGGIASVP